MDIITLLLVLLATVVLGWAALWLINKFAPGGTIRTILLAIAGILLAIFFLTQTGLMPGAESIFTRPIT